MALTRETEKSRDWAELKDKLRDFVKNFTENTSFHGVRYTFEAATCFGRTVWLVIVVGFFAWFTCQVGQRAAYYQENPVTVDMNVAYNNTLRFPSVAICNTNQFRMTKAWEAKIYRKLEAFYGADLDARKNITILDDRNLTQTMLDMAHRKEDMIKKCVWKGHSCSHENFTHLMTDFGVCYVFNDLMANSSVRDPNDFEIQNTGASFGLELFLNAEMYELSPGPHLPAGIQVLIFHGHDRPRVSDLGTAVPVFEVSRATLHLSSVTRLPYPHGDCASKALRDFKAYSFQACLAEMQTNATAKSCGCIGYGQRWAGPDKPPYCNLSTLYGCQSDIEPRQFIHKCTHPCQQEEYTTAFSNADLSTTSISAMLDIVKLDKTLQANYRKAVLLRQLVDRRTVENDISMLHSLYFSHLNLQDKIQKPLRDKITKAYDKQLIKTQVELDSLGNRLANTTQGIIDNYEFVFRVKIIENYINPKLVELEMRTWELTDTVLPFDLEPNMYEPSAENATKLLIKVLQNYYSGSIDLIYSVERMYKLYTVKILKEEQTAYNGLSVPRGIINNNRDAIIQAIDKFSQFGQVLRGKMQTFQDLAGQLPTVSKEDFDKLYDKMLAVANEISRVTLNQFQSGASELLKEMRTVSKTLADGIKKFKENLKKFNIFFDAIMALLIEYDMKKSMYSVDLVEAAFTGVVKQAFDLIPIWQSITKEELIKLVTPASEFRDAIDRYKRGSNALLETLSKLLATKSSSTIIGLIQNDIEGVEINLPDLRATAETAKVLPLLPPLEETFQDMYNLMAGVEKARDKFLAELDSFLAEVESFNSSLQIDQVMIRQNMLALQVFYQSLSLTEIVKSPAYSWFALLSDIGGTAGLFLGASFITMLELLYFIGRNIRAPKIIPAIKVKTCQKSYSEDGHGLEVL